MEIPKNTFKSALLAGEQQVGLWNIIRDPYVVQMLAGLGYDWLLIDCEHAPRDLDNVLTCLQAMQGMPTSPVVRVTENDTAEIKRVLDVGAQSILVPYVQSVEEAEKAAAAVAYPPKGVRGMSGMTRANAFGAVDGYFQKARDEICLMVQVETKQALDDLEAIAAVDGIDGVFIGPADLGASMGHVGDMMHPDVVAAVEDGLSRTRAAGLPAGFIATNDEMLEKAVAAGSLFTAVDVDSIVLQRGARARLDRWKR
ncbi:HpcH/HpaI aldolase family protein [Celeribacter sp.]|uniref:HpcH/HpaI aldolase family protein n=1 Tax=Celeribacter sp. TaxID=1890673 RepID=UPI003A914A46